MAEGDVATTPDWLEAAAAHHEERRKKKAERKSREAEGHEHEGHEHEEKDTHPDGMGSDGQVHKKIFYRTVDDSCTARLCRFSRCGCFEPHYVLTTESVKTGEWMGWTRHNHTYDVDDIRDIALTQNYGCGYCCIGLGTIHIYVNTEGKTNSVPLRNVQSSPAVFEEFSVFIHHINNMKLGIKRPEMKKIPHLIYDSTHDSCWLRCGRRITSGTCGSFPETLITKEHIVESRWNGGCTKETKQLDIDKVEDIDLYRTVQDHCFCVQSGTLEIKGHDEDQDGITIRHVQHCKKVFTYIDEYSNILNNRTRVLGDVEEMMSR